MTVEAMDRVPHVCLVNCLHPPDDVRVVEKMGRTLRAAGIDVTWVGPGIGSSPNHYGIRYHFFKPGSGRIGRLLHNHRAAFDLANRLPRADVYVGVEPDSARTAINLAWRKRSRSVFDVHEFYGDDMLGRWSIRGTRGLLKRVVRHGLYNICRDSDLVMGVNDAVLAPYDGVTTPRMIVRNCAPASFADGPPANVFSRTNGLVAIQGKSTASHGSAVVIKAFGRVARKHSNLRVIFFDVFDKDGSNLSRHDFQQLVVASGAEDVVDLRPVIPMTQMPAVLQECDVGLITYNRTLGENSLPNKLFEFMSAGLPIVAPTYSREIKAVLERERCGLLVDCEDEDAVAGAIEYLYTHRDEARQMGVRGRAAFIARHNYEAELAPFISLVRDWAQSRRS